jgi:hypothetical protein
MRKFVTMCVVVGMLLGINSSVNASTTIFSTLGPGDTYNINSGYAIGAFDEYCWELGNQFSFTGPNPYQLDSIELAVGFVSGTNVLDVWIMSDAAGKPGTIIESFNFIGDMGYFRQNNPLLVGNSVSSPTLTPDTPYWLTVSVPDDGTKAAWNRADPVVYGVLALSLDAGSWWSLSNNVGMGAFRINGTAVIPAPGAILLGGIGVALVGWLRRRRTL